MNQACSYNWNICNTTYNDYYKKQDNDTQVEHMHNVLRQYDIYLKAQYRKKHSQKTYINGAKRFIETMHIKHTGQINKQTITEYIAYLNQTKKHNTIVGYLVSLNRFLDYLQRPDLKTKTQDYKTAHRDIINKHEIQQMLQKIKQQDLTDYLILRFIIDFDCRNHEIANAKWSWIRGNTIYFHDCKTGNTKSHIKNDLLEALEYYRKNIRPRAKKGHEGYIFLNTYRLFKGTKLSVQGQRIRDLVKKTSKQVIGRELCPQDLRASVMTAEFDAYVNPKIVQRKARHSQLKTTMKYNHSSETQYIEYMQEKHILLDNKDTLFTPTTNTIKNLLNNTGTRIYTLPTDIIVSWSTDTTHDGDEDNNNVTISFFFYSSTRNWEGNIEKCVCSNLFYLLPTSFHHEWGEFEKNHLYTPSIHYIHLPIHLPYDHIMYHEKDGFKRFFLGYIPSPPRNFHPSPSASEKNYSNSFTRTPVNPVQGIASCDVSCLVNDYTDDTAIHLLSPSPENIFWSVSASTVGSTQGNEHFFSTWEIFVGFVHSHDLDHAADLLLSRRCQM